ncbi:endoglucanase [Brevundimonas sp. MYb46]|uniref:glycoside hydrolase family 5 protein n=2 Tax=Brevundimonas TaxID=41275 RepID=UPI000CFAA3E4|nr:cellulase family glycosylhydrolase [Brevundimonas sp. MYb33]PQZ84780.1 endoglucanase [Brevundimonas sp. MYb31]PRA29173.1 endoglucanase [Brevundimonas sp. MYb27]PRB14630.1 endoglucanase [Brevundimonas sp. MYb52]PRB36599.1 endoglucanase [Brevundimonas sp. MYb46]PRB55704.1 endoglucanase [Brevundimonas sp. MYb33]
MQQLMFDIDGPRFVDAQGRHAILRGVNLGGDTKIPLSHAGSNPPRDFSDHREVSFIGRPFPLEEADEHLGRIRGWGFNVLRLLTTWEAVEHAGPGQYDQDYLDYLTAVCAKANEHGLAVFIDFHQDVWSRMSGGDGAPGWVFEAIGLNLAAFDAADAAHVMQQRYDYASPERRQEDRYPMMSWPRNYQMPVNGIMWTAFFAGATLTPDWRVGERNVQDFLQETYLGAMRAVAERLRHLPNILGFDSLNEPGLGWVGQKLSQRRTEPDAANAMPVWPGPLWTPLDGLKVARGLSTTVPVMARGEGRKMEVSGETVLNPGGVSIWLEEGPDPFEVAGAWSFTDGEAVVRDEDFFRVRDGRALDHEHDFMAPFFARVAETMRSVREDWLLFGEMCPYLMLQGKTFPQPMPERTVNASHWYDIEILGTKLFDPDLPHDEDRQRYAFQLGFIRAMGLSMRDGGAPTLIGEFGIPYDLNHGEAFERWAEGERGAGVWRAHSQALGAMYDAMDGLLLSSTQWNYSATNANDLRIGDGWNQEDLSIFSRDQATTADDPASGSRALEGFSRPYVQRGQGVIAAMAFDAATARLTATIEVDAAVAEPTEIFAPSWRYPNGVKVRVSGLAAHWSHDEGAQVVAVTASEAGSLQIELTPA